MTRPLKCILVDDEPLARELIKSYIGQTPVLQLQGCYESAAEAIKSVVAGDIDLVFLDINMPLLNGIDFAGVIPASTRIIFITAYQQYAVDGFKVNALDYLLKPVSFAEFSRAVGKAVEWFAMRDSFRNSRRPSRDTITVKADYRLVQIHTDQLTYIEVQNDRVIFNRKDGSQVSSLMSLKDIEEQLPADSFMRVHRSFIVNIPNIEVVERGRIVFGKVYIPISDSRREEFFSRLSR